MANTEEKDSELKSRYRKLSLEYAIRLHCPDADVEAVIRDAGKFYDFLCVVMRSPVK